MIPFPPGTGCKSFKGIRHEKCSHTGECMRADKLETDCQPSGKPKDEDVTSRPANSTAGCDGGYFKCGDGKCIKFEYVCDGGSDCDDKSDEERGNFLPLSLWGPTSKPQYLGENHSY